MLDRDLNTPLYALACLISNIYKVVERQSILLIQMTFNLKIRNVHLPFTKLNFFCVALLLHLSCSCLTRVALVSLVSHSSYICVARVALLPLLCRSCRTSLRKKCPYSELCWSAFSRIPAEYGKIMSISPYLVQIRENADQNNSEYGHFSRSACIMRVWQSCCKIG